MTKTCKNCGHIDHLLDEGQCMHASCPCKKFETEIVVESINGKDLTKDKIICWKCKGVFSRDKDHTCTCHELEKPQKGCGKIFKKNGFEYHCSKKTDFHEERLCPECSNHSPLKNSKLPSLSNSEDKPDVSDNLEGASGSDFDLSKERKRLWKLELTKKGFEKMIKKQDKEFIRIIDRDFLEDWTKSNGKTFTLDEIRETIRKRVGRKLT